MEVSTVTNDKPASPAPWTIGDKGWILLGPPVKSQLTKDNSAPPTVYKGLLWKKEVYKPGDMVYLNSGDPDNPFMTQIVEISLGRIDETDKLAEDEPLLLGRWLVKASDVDDTPGRDSEVFIDLLKSSYEHNPFAAVVLATRPNVVTHPEYQAMQPDQNLFYFRTTIDRRSDSLHDVPPDRAARILEQFCRMDETASFTWSAYCGILQKLGDLLDVFSPDELRSFAKALTDVTDGVNRQFSLLDEARGQQDSHTIEDVKKALTAAFLDVANNFRASPDVSPKQ